MRRTLTALVVLAVIALIAVPQAAAQKQKCYEFRALYHMNLRVDLTTNEGNWVMDPEGVYALLDGQGVVPSLEIGVPTSKYVGKVGLDRGGDSTYRFSPTDNFTVGDWHAAYQYSPGKAAMYNYQALGKITGGTGMFQNATGSLTESGPYLLWVDPAEPNFLLGRYSGSVVANVCVGK